MVKIVIWSPYPKGQAPSQRFRFESTLYDCKYNITQLSFYSLSAWQVIYQPGHAVSKVNYLWLGFIKRWGHLLKSLRADFIFLHREAAPVGPPIFEWILSRVLRKKLIYDFDDAIWLTDASESKWTKKLRWRSKVSKICGWSYKVSCGNDYLARFALLYNSEVHIIPTTIDISQRDIHPKRHVSKSQMVGWTGSHTTLKYLKNILPQLAAAQKNIGFSFTLICNRDPLWEELQYQFIPWNKETEWKDLAALDVGLMPLPDDAWTRGKCGFKALQYMALGIPALVSPVGVNSEIIEHGVNGYLCHHPSDWEKYIKKSLNDHVLRNQLGEKGYDTVTQHFSNRAVKSQYDALFS